MKELIYKINHEENFDKANGMLEMLNAIYGTEYFMMNRRVTEIKEHRFHDVWVNF